MIWGSYIRDGQFEKIDRAGSRLSLVIKCPVHYPAFNKNLFECKCGTVIPFYLVNAAMHSGDWTPIKEKHGGILG